MHACNVCGSAVQRLSVANLRSKSSINAGPGFGRLAELPRQVKDNVRASINPSWLPEDLCLLVKVAAAVLLQQTTL